MKLFDFYNTIKYFDIINYNINLLYKLDIFYHILIKCIFLYLFYIGNCSIISDENICYFEDNELIDNFSFPCEIIEIKYSNFIYYIYIDLIIKLVVF